MPPTIRSLAKSLRLAPTTVSDALRGRGRIRPDTVDRVLHAARLAGYHTNPLTTALMSEIRRSHAATFRGTLAAIEISEPDHPVRGPYAHELLGGANSRAAELGYKIECFVVGRGHLSIRRLAGILHARGALGVLVLPALHPPDLSGLSWSQLTGVYLDSTEIQPHLSKICPDHFRSIQNLLTQLENHGYRRPGLHLSPERDARLAFTQSAAFHAFLSHNPALQPIPLLSRPADRDSFSDWVRQHRPDVILTHQPEAITWLTEDGLRVPNDVGVALLNLTATTQPSAGLDLQPRMIGRCAAELIIGQLHRGERGPPSCPAVTMLAAQWREGPTIRQP